VLTTSTAVIWFIVRVPVLSELIAETKPSVSTEGRSLTIAFCLARSTPPMDRMVCDTVGSASGIAALNLSTIITGHKDPGAPDDDATRVLDQSRRYVEDFDQAVAKSGMPLEVIEEMLAKYPAYGNRYTLFASAFSQFPS